MFPVPPAPPGPGKSAISSAPPLHPTPAQATWTLTQFLGHRQGGSGQIWGMSGAGQGLFQPEVGLESHSQLAVDEARMCGRGLRSSC